MALSRKHYIALAEILATHRENILDPNIYREVAFQELLCDICSFCFTHGQNFDRARFEDMVFDRE